MILNTTTPQTPPSLRKHSPKLSGQRSESFIANVCIAATFHSVSFSKPNSVWFGKVTPKNAKDFTNQFQFGLETKKMICKTQIPNQIQIGLEQFDEHCQRPENSKRHCASLRPNLDPLFIPNFGFHLCYISWPRL